MDRWPILMTCCLWACLPMEWLGAQVPSSAAGSVKEKSPLPWAEDATLRDVTFVDSEFGWAVGERGTIVHTTNGGQSWQRQKSPTNVGLHGVSFVSRKLGWAVGGETRPYLWTSHATVLRTTDGGQTWQEQLVLLPALERVKFFDADHSVAWGRGSGGEPLGVFATDDSGRNWRSVAVGWQAAWSGGDFVNQHTGIVVGPGGQAARVVNGDAAKLTRDEIGSQDLRAVQLADDGAGWAVGNHGTILRTKNGGATWTVADVLPADLRETINWQTVAIHGKQVWIAGSPGTVVLHSPDAGETWQGHATGSCVPLHGMSFIDDQHGWAVGDFATILHTHDGGQTWQVQHGGDRRAAVLVVLANERQIPWETLAKLNSDGYRTVVHLTSGQQNREDAANQARLVEALASIGCNAISRSPYPMNPGIAADRDVIRERLLTEIASQLRLWRPAVLVVPSADGAQEYDKLIADTAELAVTQAASESQLPHLSEQLALAPWQVSRMFALLPAGSRGTHRVKSVDAVPFAKKTLGEMATAARSLLNRDFQTAPETNEFLLKASFTGEPTTSVDDLAAGLSLVPGSDCRRPLAAVPTTIDPQAQRRLVEKRRNLANIFRYAEGNPALLAQVGQMMGDLEESSAAALLFELAAQFEQAGQLQLAVDTRELLLRRCHNAPLVEQTLVWLVEFYASSETAHAYRPVASNVSQALAVEGMDPGVRPATALAEVSAIKAPTNDFSQQRYARAVQLAEYVAQTRPLLYTEPQLRVPSAVAERKRETSESADRYLQSLSLRFPGEAWQECGAVERWLAEPDKPKPNKPRVICRFTGTKPMLDGKLDEPFWQQSAAELQTVATQSAIRNLKSEIVVAHDEEFLYLGIRCAKSPQLNYCTGSGSRIYDADLTEQDRVRILLDLDRDYTTYFALTVDHRGWTNDACWQDPSWNPKWFVSADSEAQHWTVEAAIPFSELTEAPPKIGDAWTVGCERVLPGSGGQTLTGSNFGEPGPRKFGVLQFK